MNPCGHEPVGYGSNNARRCLACEELRRTHARAPRGYSYWRNLAAPIIARALAATDGAAMKDRRRALRAAYPFGLRQHWPYRVWLDQIARMTGRRPPLFARQRGRIENDDPRQMRLFERNEGKGHSE